MGVGGQRHALATLPPGKGPVPFAQQAGWAPGPVWTGAENLTPPRHFDPRTVHPVAIRYTDWATPSQLCRLQEEKIRTWVAYRLFIQSATSLQTEILTVIKNNFSCIKKRRPVPSAFSVQGIVEEYIYIYIIAIAVDFHFRILPWGRSELKVKQSLDSTEGSRTWRLPDFKTFGTWRW